MESSSSPSGSESQSMEKLGDDALNPLDSFQETDVKESMDTSEIQLEIVTWASESEDKELPSSSSASGSVGQPQFFSSSYCPMSPESQSMENHSNLLDSSVSSLDSSKETDAKERTDTSDIQLQIVKWASENAYKELPSTSSASGSSDGASDISQLDSSPELLIIELQDQSKTWRPVEQAQEVIELSSDDEAEVNLVSQTPPVNPSDPPQPRGRPPPLPPCPEVSEWTKCPGLRLNLCKKYHGYLLQWYPIGSTRGSPTVKGYKVYFSGENRRDHKVKGWRFLTKTQEDKVVVAHLNPNFKYYFVVRPELENGLLGRFSNIGGIP